MEPRVLPRQDAQVQKILKDFRVEEDGNSCIAQVRGAGKFRSAVASIEPEHVLVEFVSSEAWTRPKLWQRWLVALRLPYLGFSLFPLLLVLSTFWKTNLWTHWNFALQALLSLSALHIGCNLWDDYEDHIRGVDSPESQGGSGVIQKLWIPAVHVRSAAAAFFLLGLALGVHILVGVSWAQGGRDLFWIGIIGSFAAASFSGWPFHYKYFALGEPIVFLVGGPLIACGAVSLLFQDADYFPYFIWTSLPLSFLAVLRLHLGNMQRIPFDKMANSKTIANIVGFATAKKLSFFLFVAPFAVNALFCKLQLVPWLSFFSTLWSLPFAFFAINLLLSIKGPLDPSCTNVRKHAMHFHIAYGALYILSFLF